MTLRRVGMIGRWRPTLDVLEHHRSIRTAEPAEMRTLPHGIGHIAAGARGITQAAEKIRFRRCDDINGAAFQCARFAFERGYNGAADPHPAQWRQRHDRSQQRVAAVNLKPAEAGRDIGRGLKTPEQRFRLDHIIGRQARLYERGLETIALPGRERRYDQTTGAGHYDISIIRARSAEIESIARPGGYGHLSPAEVGYIRRPL